MQPSSSLISLRPVTRVCGVPQTRMLLYSLGGQLTAATVLCKWYKVVLSAVTSVHQQRVLDPMGLELQMVVSCHVGAGN